MTEENCHTELWTADREKDYPTTFIGKIKAFIESFKRWWPLFTALIKDKLGN